MAAFSTLENDAGQCSNFVAASSLLMAVPRLVASHTDFWRLGGAPNNNLIERSLVFAELEVPLHHWHPIVELGTFSSIRISDMDPLRNIPRLSELSGHLKRLSPTDRGSFSALTSVSDIQAWTSAKAEEYLQFSLALLAIHNLAAPIHRLPTEVLEQVFANCWHDRKCLRLSHTCSLWRSIILGRAALWADAAANWGPLFDKKPIVYSELPFVDTVLSRCARHSGGIKPFFRTFSPGIVNALAPHVGNVVSLRVTLDCQSDLYYGLWPTLCSGMPRLDALHVEFIKRVVDPQRDADYEGELDEDEDSEYEPLQVDGGYMWDLQDPVWGSLNILSGQNLPQLSRLTCPISLVRLFNRVPLRHLKIAAGNVHNHNFSDADTPKLHLSPYRKTLETLELVGEVMLRASRPGGVDAVQLPSIRQIRITSPSPTFISGVLSWLAFPLTTYIDLTCDDSKDDRAIPYLPFQDRDRSPPSRPLFQEFFSSRNSNNPLHAVVATVDRVAIRCPPERWHENDSIQCFAGDDERLRMEHFLLNPAGLVDAFGKYASVTHLRLSFSSDHDGPPDIDLRAFPHLVNLEMEGPGLIALACMLGPTSMPKPPAKGRSVKGPGTPALCPSLAELVITCELTVTLAAPTSNPKRKPKGRAASTRSATKMKREPSTNADKVFQEHGSVLQQVLACREASSTGTRLASLELRLRPALVFKRAPENLPFPPRCRAVSGDPVWPSPAAREAVIESLDELVDGDVVIKLLDKPRHEIDVDEEDEA